MAPADEQLPPLLAAEPPDYAEALDPAQERRLAAHMRALAEITPAVAHDLRAPINAMVLNLEVLRETVSSGRAGEPAGRERLLRYAGVLRDELAKLHRSLEIFLGQISPRSDRIESLDLSELAAELAALLAAPAHKQLIEVRTTVPATPVLITANRYLLRQALLHFGLAALATVPHPGRLEVALVTESGRARLRIAGGAPLRAASTPSSALPLERLEVARSLLAAQHGEARSCGGAGAEGDLGFEIELPLSLPR